MPSTTIGVDIIAKDRASATLSKIGGAAGSSTSKFSKMASVAKVAFSALAVGVTAVGGVIALGLKDAAEYQKLQAQTGAVLKSTGGAAHVTAGHVRDLANSIAAYSDGNDDAVQTGENMLLTFTNIRNGVGKTNQIFDEATKTVVDMSFALGQDATSSAMQLGKALNDPVKGITALQRVGVAFTDAQKKQITAMVKAGDTMKAQKIILGELHKEFGGSARAAGQTFAGAMGRLKDALGDTLRNAVMPLLPRLTDLADWAAKTIPKAIKVAKHAFADLKGVLKDIAGKISDALGGIDIKGLGGKLAKQAQGWAAPVINGFKKGLDSGDWSGLGKALGSGIFKAIGAFGSIAGKIGEALGNVDWVGLGLEVGKKAVPFFIGFAAGLLNFDIGSTFKQIMAHWSDILLGVLAIALPGERVAGKIGELLLKIPFVGKLLSWGFLALNRFSRKMVGKVFEALRFLGKAFLEGFRKVFPTVGKSFAEHLALFPLRVQLMALKVAEKAKGMVRGLGAAIAKGIGFVVSKIGELIAKMLKPWVNANTWLVRKGVDVLAGLVKGILSKVGDVLAPLRALGGKIKAALGNVGTLLYQSGKDLVNGLWNGIKAQVGGLLSFVGSVAGKVKSAFRNPLGMFSPSKVFRGYGQNIMEGLLLGIHDKELSLQSAMDRISGAVSKAGDLISHMMDKISNLQSTRSGFLGTFTGDSVFGQDLSTTTQDAEGNDITHKATAADLIAFQKKQAEQAKRLARDIRNVTKRGLSKALVKQLQSQGTAGAATLHALAQGNAGDIAQLNRLNKQTNASLRAAGLRAGNFVRGGSIDADIKHAVKQEHILERQENTLQRLEHHLKDIAQSQKKDQTIVVEIDGEAVIKAIHRRNKRKGVKSAGV